MTTKFFYLEHRDQPLLPRGAFMRRLARAAGLAGGLLAASLAGGVLGYRFLAGMAWIDALLNASMILGGMGPIDPVKTTSGKLFAAGYAIFCGVVLITSVGVLFAPIVHRLMHRFHMPTDEDRK